LVRGGNTRVQRGNKIEGTVGRARRGGSANAKKKGVFTGSQTHHASRGDLLLVGSPKQQQWAQKIISQLQSSGYGLPNVLSSQVVIANRDLPPEMLVAVLREAPVELSGPNFLQFPRYAREDAVTVARLLPQKTVIVDKETDGIGKNAQIVQIGLVALHEPDNCAESYVRPTTYVGYDHTKARQINGIPDSRLKHAPTIAELWEKQLRAIFNTWFFASYHNVSSG
jgi:hypothetical protein